MTRTKGAVVALAIAVALAVTGSISAQADPGNTITASATDHVEYARAIKLSSGTILSSINYYPGFSPNDDYSEGRVRFYKSTNNGGSFSFVSEFDDTTLPAGTNIASPTIFETSPGVLLLAFTASPQNQNDLQSMKVFRSTNEGVSWTYLSTPESAQWNWEPELSYSTDGKLQLFYSWAATPNVQDQVIVRRESTDGGLTWGSRIVALGSNPTLNIGMPRVVKASSSLYYMAYENYEDGAQNYIATSADGKTFTHQNRQVETTDGWFQTTPSLAYVNGTLYVIGMRFKQQAIPFLDAGNNGKVMLYSKDGGVTWNDIQAPFDITFADLHSNWSPALLPLSSTSMLLVTASDTSTQHRLQFGTGSLYEADNVNDGTVGTGTNQFQYTGTWSSGWAPTFYRADNHWSNQTNAAYTVRFTGRQVKVVTKTGNDNGIMGISVDGGSEVLVDLYSATEATGVVAWTSANLTNGNHTITVRVTGSKNASSAGTYINADKVQVVK